MQVIAPQQLMSQVTEYWQPMIIGELNGQVVKIARLNGEFIFHHHENEDEMFYVLKGTLRIEFPETSREVNQGEFIIIPRGIEHKPVAREDVEIMLFEPASTVNTGNIVNERTISSPKTLLNSK